MKILYVFDSQDHEVFKMSDLPDRFEILREGKKPIVFKPAAIQMQDILSRLYECEAMLQRCNEFGLSIQEEIDLDKDINDYFDRQ